MTYVIDEQRDLIEEVCGKYEHEIEAWCAGNRFELVKWFNDNFNGNLVESGERFAHYCVVKFMEYKSETKTEE